MSSPETDHYTGEEDRPARIVVIGFGSPIRGDDAFGPLVADRLAEVITAPEVEVLSRHILTAEMAEALRDATLVLFVDAAIDGPVGEVVERPLTPRRDVEDTIAHSVDARGLLAWTEGLYGYAPPARLLSTRAVTLEYAHYQLSPAVQAAVEPLLARVQELVQNHLNRLQNA